VRDFDIEAVLVCDDIRVEKSNKHILIGVYSGDIVATIEGEGVAMLNLAFFIEIMPKTIGEHTLDVRVEMSDLGKVGEMLGLYANVKKLGSAVVPIGPVPVPISGEGLLTLSMRMNRGKWQKLRTKKVTILRPSPSPATPAT
jgi:hypothetical protein